MINRWTRVALAGVFAATLSMPIMAETPAPQSTQELSKADKDAAKKAAEELKKKNYESYKAAAKAAKEKAEAEKKAAEAKEQK
jgi:hypothetical protein